MNNKIKKNILDLYFQKHLVIASTSIIIAFTYLVGVGIALLTKQIKLHDFTSIKVVVIFSILIISSCIILFIKASYQIRNISEILKTIKI